ncbi:ACT domain-containing protein [Salinisphaera sp.]|uniref:ACT domain-containing protein n=1 Tax=Salinisphaera sp. TaxID=1914330 RepID=UPI002D7A1798|nr:ACT domain-containing protein [Salinisphaera sp.]HET7315553.1 ACT domain-containing protein [Salinisphaera sp.]
MIANAVVERHRFICRLDLEPAALERLVQAVRRRGFTIERVGAERASDGLLVDLTVSGARPAETLRAHLEKIHTVQSVQRPRDRCFIADRG